MLNKFSFTKSLSGLVFSIFRRKLFLLSFHNNPHFITLHPISFLKKFFKLSFLIFINVLSSFELKFLPTDVIFNILPPVEKILPLIFGFQREK